MNDSDDTSVAILEKQNDGSGKRACIHFLANITSDSRAHRGIHPILALESHQENMASLVDKALRHLPAPKGTLRSLHLADGSKRRLDTGKALSVAWQIPLVGMSTAYDPQFPFLSILVSGGHSILVHSKSITDHKIMASSEDIAMGETLDKAAREILPAELLQGSKTTMYGKALERFVFPNGEADFADYRPPTSRGEELIRRQNSWGWSITTPFANTRVLQLSFSSVASMVNKIIKSKEGNLSYQERVDLGREAMRVCFEHLASRTIIALEELRIRHRDEEEIRTLVVSGGVAANKFLMAVLRSFLDVRGFEHVKLVAPPPSLCTDNAAMIGWAGIEMFEGGWRSDLSCRAIRKWTLDPQAEDGGVLGPNGWIHESTL
ncbi:hypothetical protein N7470_003047 [Penicillium chermesinum]|nr:hypothetical protein N7470_003047 [Penicillium chermesinum]